jgi:hypothetical protein
MDEEMPVVGSDESDYSAKLFQAMYDAPAYIRRARNVEAALEILLARARTRREEWLPMPRLRIGMLHAMAGDWPALRPLVADDTQLGLLESLHRELAPRLRGTVDSTTSKRRLGGALRDLRESLELFNRRWLAFLPTLDLAQLNALREGYNRYYVVEKECAMRNPRLARQGFTPLKPFTAGDLLERLPLFALPLLAG